MDCPSSPSGWPYHSPAAAPDPGDSLFPTVTDTVRLMGSDLPTTRSCLRHSIVLECALRSGAVRGDYTGSEPPCVIRAAESLERPVFAGDSGCEKGLIWAGFAQGESCLWPPPPP